MDPAQTGVDDSGQLPRIVGCSPSLSVWVPMRRLLPLLLALVALLAASLSSPLAASAEEDVLDKPRRGADAVRALGTNLAAVARAHEATTAGLRKRLEADLSLWVDVSGRLFYVDPAARDHTDHTETATSTTEPTTATPANVFTLHSRPSAQRTIHLDFDGHGGAYGGDIGNAWDSGYTGGDGVAEPYTLDSDYAFSDAERAEIYDIWRRVAEDFAPFDVNVTTATPALEKIDRVDGADAEYGTRVAITSTDTDCGCGGVAYVGVFDYYGSRGHSHYQPAFVYNHGAKAAAEAASHEAGHNLGLSHDGGASSPYYVGHGDWAPIMGVGYYEPITQWSRGEYSGATNSEDDFAVAGANGAPLRLDDHGTGAAATAVGAGQHAGTIHGRTDVDDLSFSLSAEGAVTVDATPAVVSPNLDIEAVLRREDGSTVDVSNPLSAGVDKDTASGLSATISATLAAGTYTLSIDGVGAHDPLTSGYSDYASLGSYVVALTGSTIAAPTSGSDTSGGDTTTDTAGEPTTAPAVPAGVSATLVGSAVTVAWTHDGVHVSSFDVQREKRQRNGSWVVAAVVAVTDPAARTLSDSPGAGTFRYAVRAVNAIGPSNWSPASDPVSVAKTTGTKSTK